MTICYFPSFTNAISLAIKITDAEGLTIIKNNNF